MWGDRQMGWFATQALAIVAFGVSANCSAPATRMKPAPTSRPEGDLAPRYARNMRLVTLTDLSPTQVESLAAMTFEAAKQHSPGWLPTLEKAQEEISDALAPGREHRVVLGGNEPLGWIAGWHQWGRVWEVHPLMVSPEYQHKGVGRRLVAEIESAIWRHGALTIVVGTSDMTNATTVSGIDLYQDPLKALQNLQCVRAHPVGFWQRVGYKVVGIVPDGETIGKPSITLAKGAPRG